MATLLSIVIVYNREKTIRKEPTIFSSNTETSLNLGNKIIFVILALLFLYVNYKQWVDAKKDGKNISPYLFQLIASILAVSAGLLSLYAMLIANNNISVSIQNPQI
jgi:hypothetical protein